MGGLHAVAASLQQHAASGAAASGRLLAQTAAGEGKKTRLGSGRAGSDTAVVVATVVAGGSWMLARRAEAAGYPRRTLWAPLPRAREPTRS